MAIALWLTGLSASGKTTLALAAAELLAPRLTLDTHLLSVAECVARIEHLLNQGTL